MLSLLLSGVDAGCRRLQCSKVKNVKSFRLAKKSSLASDWVENLNDHRQQVFMVKSIGQPDSADELPYETEMLTKCYKVKIEAVGLKVMRDKVNPQFDLV